MTREEKTRWVVERARAEGFDLCGVAAVEQMDELARLPEWLASGYAGDMKYLHDERRGDPRKALAGARSVVVVALNYNTAHPRTHEARGVAEGEAPRGWISRYAWGDDYHDVLREKLEALVGAMRAEFTEPFEARAYVDTGPIVERIAAKYAGLGWLGKNTCLINQQKGSWLFLGTILTTLELEPSIGTKLPATSSATSLAASSDGPARDLCGSCTRCLDACPTGAFPAPYVLDARRCISYLTIELRGSIPEEFRAAMGSAVIGCDICQDVCPWNRKAPMSALAAFQPRTFDADGSEARGQSLFAPELEWLASLTQEEFSRIFRKSAAKRAKWRGLVRNACMALGNAQIAEGSETQTRVTALLARLAQAKDALIAEHARWALERISARTGEASTSRVNREV
jgi:epoxyqueuosine reductase